jgi:hypothetical protein
MKRLKHALQWFIKNVKRAARSITRFVFQPSKATALGFLMFASLLLIASSFAWWRLVFSDPEKVFEDMLTNSVQVTSVTRTVAQDEPQQSLQQINRLLLGSQAIVDGKTELSQQGFVNAKVTTSNIGTPYRDYVRYDSITTSQQNGDDGSLDFSECTGKWGASFGEGQERTVGELFSENVLGIIPFGRVSSEDKPALLDQLLNGGVYEVDYLGVTKEIRDGRLQYTYPVALQPRQYVAYLVNFARAQRLTQLEGVNPADYSGAQAIRFNVTIDMWSRQAVSVSYNENPRTESYTGYGIVQPVVLPPADEVIPVSELQSCLQDAQNPAS